MPHFRYIALALALFAAPAAAQDVSHDSGQQPAASHPTLVVAISVDQFSTDLFNQYRAHFTRGIGRLMQGAVFPAGYQAHAATETCPGHSTILTGNHPAHTGIIANDWIEFGVAREDKTVYCAEDTSVAGSSSDDYTPSVAPLLVPTLGDLMTRADPESRVVAVAGKDRAAIMMGGHNADYEIYPGGEGMTVLPGTEGEPAALAAANRRIHEALASPRAAYALPAQCAAFDRAVPIGNGDTVGTYRFAREPGDRRLFQRSPDADAVVLDLADDLVDEMGMGRRGHTDLLILGLSATDYIGHTFGPGGVEMCIQMDALDAALGSFFDALDARGISFVAMMTADHGGLDLPERQRAQGAGDAERLDPGPITTLNATLATEMGLPGPIVRSAGPIGDYYIEPLVPADRHAEAIERAGALLRADPQVYGVYTRDEIMADPISEAPPESWTVLDRLRASYYPGRSGDFLVVLKPRVTPIPDPGVGYVATHGSVWDYDRRVPILFWWPGAEHMEQPLGVMTVDIMPTLASLIGLDIASASIDGHCLDVTASIEASNCAAEVTALRGE